MYTPWGKSQYSKKICRGINFYGTASHGGYKISNRLNQQIPEYMRSKNGWYEEDCMWAIPYIIFSEKIGIDEKEMKLAVNTLKQYFWKEYERYFNEVISAGESEDKDNYMFFEKHSNDWLGISASSDHEMVKVFATVGGKRGDFCNGRYFLIPASEYSKRGIFPFVVDPLIHKELIF